MRDIAILGIILWGAFAALRKPWIGVIMWTWVSVMNPHTQGWGFIRSMPVAFIVAVATLLGFVLTRDRRNPFLDPAVVFLALFMAWICIGWPMSYYPSDSTEMLTRVLKIDLMVIITVALIIKREQIHWFVWIVVFSIGFYGVKGGAFTLATGGGYRVWGPGGFIGGNNEIALAIILVIPFMYYAYQTVDPARIWLRRGLLVSLPLSAAAAIGSHSRGALLAIAAMAAFLWWRSQKKFAVGIILGVVGFVLLAFMPSNWTERMQTIETYDKDASAMGRINAWYMAWNLANDHLLTGGGFAIYEAPIFAKYAPDPFDIHAAHSVYFQILGEHGWIGLFLWMGIWWFTWRAAGWLRAHGKAEDGSLWCSQLGAMCQVSLVGYAVGGAFLSLAYFDLPYNIMVIVVATKAWMLEHKRAFKASPVSTGGKQVTA